MLINIPNMILDENKKINGCYGGPSVRVRVNSAGDQKIRCIKIVRELSGWGLRESKEFVDNLPQDMVCDVKPAIAEEFKQRLEEIGASVDIATYLPEGNEEFVSHTVKQRELDDGSPYPGSYLVKVNEDAVPRWKTLAEMREDAEAEKADKRETWTWKPNWDPDDVD